jgi:hypothetical protein
MGGYEMNGKQDNAKSADATNGAVALIVDYSNGVQKSFVGIPWKHDMAVFDALEAAGSISPGLTFEFAKSGVDRGGRDIGSILSIDGLGADQPDQKWLVWVNREFFGTELRTVGTHAKSGLPAVEPGDVIALKLAAGP